MSDYLGGDVVLTEAEMQADTGVPVVVVEGATDKAMLAPKYTSVNQVVVSTGKMLLLEAHSLMRDDYRGRIVFIVDCDDDVPRGRLRGATDLIITTNGDMEADLVSLGALRWVVSKVVPAALRSEARLDEVTEQVRERSSAVAIEVGRVRRAARTCGIKLDFEPWDLQFGVMRTPGTVNVDAAAVFREVIRAGGLREVQRRRIEARIEDHPCAYRVCNGKDVLEAAVSVLMTDFRVPRRKLGAIVEMAQSGVAAERFESWDVVRRVRRWEERYGMQLLGKSG